MVKKGLIKRSHRIRRQQRGGSSINDDGLCWCGRERGRNNYKWYSWACKNNISNIHNDGRCTSKWSQEKINGCLWNDDGTPFTQQGSVPSKARGQACETCAVKSAPPTSSRRRKTSSSKKESTGSSKKGGKLRQSRRRR